MNTVMKDALHKAIKEANKGATKSSQIQPAQEYYHLSHLLSEKTTNQEILYNIKTALKHICSTHDRNKLRMCINQVKTIYKDVGTAENINTDKLKGKCDYLVTLLCSILSGIQTRISDSVLMPDIEVAIEKTTGVLKGLDNFYLRVEKRINELKESTEEKEEQAVNQGDLENISEDTFDNFKKYLDIVTKQINDESAISKLFINLPVIPTFNRSVHTDELNSRGYDAIYVAGYKIIKNCKILAVNLTQINNQALDTDVVLEFQLDKLNKVTKKNYEIFMEEPILIANVNWLFYWVEERDIIKKYTAMHNGELSSLLIPRYAYFPF